MRIAKILCQFVLMIMSMTNVFAGEQDSLITFAVSPDETRIYSVHENGRHSVIMVRDTATGTLIKTIPTPFVPTVSFKPSLAITPNGKKLYIVDVNKRTYVLDLQTYQLSKIKNKPKDDTGYEYSSPVSMMPDGKHLYVAEGVGQLRNPPVIHVIDTATDRADIAASRKQHYEEGWFNGVTAFSNASSLLYISRELQHYEYDIAIFDTRTHRLMDEVISVKRHLSSMAIHPATGKLYLLEGGTVEIIDPVTRSVVDTLGIRWTNNTFGMAFALNGAKLYVLDDSGFGVIHVIDTLTRQVHDIEAGVYSNGSNTSEIKYSENSAKIYVSTVHDTILIIDANTDTVIREM